METLQKPFYGLTRGLVGLEKKHLQRLSTVVKKPIGFGQPFRYVLSTICKPLLIAKYGQPFRRYGRFFTIVNLSLQGHPCNVKSHLRPKVASQVAIFTRLLIITYRPMTLTFNNILSGIRRSQQQMGFS